MKYNFMKKIMPLMFAAVIFCMSGVTVGATEAKEPAAGEETQQETVGEERKATELTFEIGNFTYEMLEKATQEDMPNGFTLTDWEYNGVPVKAGKTENSDMICVLGVDWESGYEYRFIYDPNHEMFTPYFGTDIKNGYIYTIPLYEGAEVPYGFNEAYYVIQTVPMFVFQRDDAELTQEEIALGVLSDDNYLVFLMMDENGNEVHYTYDLIDRTYQRALLQKKDAESVTEVNELNDKLHQEIGKLNADHTARMNKRLALIGVLIAIIVIMAGVMVNLLLKLNRMKQEIADHEDTREEDAFETDWYEENGEEWEDSEVTEPEETETEETEAEETEPEKTESLEEDDLEILDLDEEDL